MEGLTQDDVTAQCVGKASETAGHYSPKARVGVPSQAEHSQRVEWSHGSYKDIQRMLEQGCDTGDLWKGRGYSTQGSRWQHTVVSLLKERQKELLKFAKLYFVSTRTQRTVFRMGE